MKIFLTFSTERMHGGGLGGRLNYFHKRLESELENAGLETSFDEFHLQLSCLSKETELGMLSINEKYREYYNTLPRIRIERKRTEIHVILQAPQFVDYLQKMKTEGQASTISQEEDFNDLELANVLLDKYLEASNLVFQKLNKSDAFDLEKFSLVVDSMKKKLNFEFLDRVNEEEREKIRHERLQQALDLREKRKQTNKVLNKQIRDVRVYYTTNLPKKFLYPYDVMYSEIFLNKLQHKNIMCPEYDHLYIEVATTLDDAIIRSTGSSWFVYGIATIDDKEYVLKSEKEKEEIVFSLVEAGLTDIFKLDKLDIKGLSEILQEVKREGIHTELNFRSIENSKYMLDINYKVVPTEKGCPIYFILTDKISGKSKKTVVDFFTFNSLEELYLGYQKVSMTSKQIKIKASNSVRTNVYLKDRSKQQIFEIADLL